MIQISLLEKLNILKDVISSSYIYLIIFGIIILFTIYFSNTNKYNYYDNKQLFIISQVLILLLILVKFNTSIGLMFDYFMQNIFVLIYFPNLSIYMFAIIIANVIMFYSIFGKRVIKIVKIINASIYTLFNFLFVLFLGIVINNNLNVFEHSSIYNNEQARVILELSGVIFSLWILYLTVYTLTRGYFEYERTPRFIKKQVQEDLLHEVSIDKPIVNNTKLKQREYINNNDDMFYKEELNYESVLDKITSKEEFEKLQRLLIEYKEVHNKQTLKLDELNEIIERNII